MKVIVNFIIETFLVYNILLKFCLSVHDLKDTYGAEVVKVVEYPLQQMCEH